MGRKQDNGEENLDQEEENEEENAEEEDDEEDDGEEDESEDESEANEMTLDEDGRVPGGLLDNPKPPELNYDFRSWGAFLDVKSEAMDKVLKDVKTVFSARNSRVGEAYSVGETYFLPAAMTPRCGMERLAHAIFKLHTVDLIPGEDYDENLSGAEWWTLVLDGEDDVGFHWDRDYALEDDGINVHPHLSTVTYLTSAGGPTIVVDVVGSMQRDNFDSLCGPVSHGWLSRPVAGKHISFDGRLLHGAPAEANVWGGTPPRMTFLVNIWLNHKPLSSDTFPAAKLPLLETYEPPLTLQPAEQTAAPLEPQPAPAAAGGSGITVLQLKVKAEGRSAILSTPVPLNALREACDSDGAAAVAGGSFRLKFGDDAGSLGMCSLTAVPAAGRRPAKRARAEGGAGGG